VFKLSESQLKTLDSCVRLSLNDDGLIAIFEDLRAQAIKFSTVASASDAQLHLGRIQMLQTFLDFVQTVPTRLDQIERARSRPDPRT
jgi:hypothetical protein